MGRLFTIKFIVISDIKANRIKIEVDEVEM